MNKIYYYPSNKNKFRERSSLRSFSNMLKHEISNDLGFGNHEIECLQDDWILVLIFTERNHFYALSGANKAPIKLDYLWNQHKSCHYKVSRQYYIALMIMNTGKCRNISWDDELIYY